MVMASLPALVPSQLLDLVHPEIVVPLLHIWLIPLSPLVLLLSLMKVGDKLPGTSAVTVTVVSVRTTVPTTVLARRTQTANVSLVLMVRRSGLALIALFAHVLAISPGLVMLSTPITSTLGLSAPIRVPVTVNLVPANVSLGTMVLLANVPHALIIVMTVVLAGLRSTLPLRQEEHITPLGIT